MTRRSSRGEGLEGFRKYLRAFNHPVTPQRLHVAEVLFGTHRHVSAEEILEQLEADGHTVGKATVYRTLELLLTAGLIREHDFGDGFKRYEPLPTRPRHEHLVCTACGKVIEFESRAIDRVADEIAALHRFYPTHHKVEFYGLCEDCKE